MTDPKQLIRALARTFELESEAANDLLTWLPSYHFGQKLYGEGFVPMPSVSALMQECCELLSVLKHRDQGDFVMQKLLDFTDDFEWEERGQTRPTVADMRKALIEMKYLPEES